MGGAVGADQRLGMFEVGAGHGREQVVLDLVVEPTHHEVGEVTAPDVAGHQHLAAQEVDLHAGRHQGHALVVGGEGATEQQPEQRELHGDERRRLGRGQQQEHGGEETTEADCDERQFQPTVGDAALLQQRLHAIDV